MKIFSEVDSNSKKGIVVLTGLVAIAAVFVLGVLLVFPEREGERPQRKRAAAAPMEITTPVSSPWVSRIPRAPKKRAVPENEKAHSMNVSSVRQTVRVLKKAAAEGNHSLKAAMLAALSRYPGGTEDIVLEELSATSNPAVREALHEALSHTKR